MINIAADIAKVINRLIENNPDGPRPTYILVSSTMIIRGVCPSCGFQLRPGSAHRRICASCGYTWDEKQAKKDLEAFDLLKHLT
jgi:rubredoxin